MSLQWIEIDGRALASNLRSFRELVGAEVRLAPVIKSNGYGHGLELAARAFVQGGAQWLCVHSPAEASRAVNCGTGATILQLGPVDPGALAAAIDAGVHLTVSTPKILPLVLEVAASRGRRAKIHLKVETGTWRQGATDVEFGTMLSLLRDSPHADLEGIHSHFANIEDTTRHEYARTQLERYESLLTQAGQAGCVPRLRHIASSAATLVFPRTRFDLVRPGIAAYGYWPSRETLVSAQSAGSPVPVLSPAITWKSVLTEIKTVPAGSYIGYGCTDKVEVDTRLAIVPVGYADGYRRAMGGRAHVLVRGRRCAVRGRICMNLVMVDVGHVEGASTGDEVVLLGRQDGEEITAETLADWSHTLHYEVLAGLNPEIERRTV